MKSYWNLSEILLTYQLIDRPILSRSFVYFCSRPRASASVDDNKQTEDQKSLVTNCFLICEPALDLKKYRSSRGFIFEVITRKSQTVLLCQSN